MTDKQGFRIDNAGNLASESNACSHRWVAPAQYGSAAEAICDRADMLLANIPDEPHRRMIARHNDEARAAITTTGCIMIGNEFMMLDDADRDSVRLADSQYNEWTVANAFDADFNFGIFSKLAIGAWTQATPDSKEITQIIVWRIDCPDHSPQWLRPRPWDPSATAGVITLMLANEY